jgi:hypothetical protein
MLYSFWQEKIAALMVNKTNKRCKYFILIDLSL